MLHASHHPSLKDPRSRGGDVDVSRAHRWLMPTLVATLTLAGCAGEEAAQAPTPQAPATKAQPLRRPPPEVYQSYGYQPTPGAAYPPYEAKPTYPYYEPGRYPRETYPSAGYAERWPDRPQDAREPWDGDWAEQRESWRSQWPQRPDERAATPRERYWGGAEPEYDPWNRTRQDGYPSRSRPYYEPEAKPGLPTRTETLRPWELREERPWARQESPRRTRKKRRADTQAHRYREAPEQRTETYPPPYISSSPWGPYTYPAYPGDYYSEPKGYPRYREW